VEFIIPKRFVSPRGVAVSYGLSCALIGLFPESAYKDIVFRLPDDGDVSVSVPDIESGGWQSDAAVFDELEPPSSIDGYWVHTLNYVFDELEALGLSVPAPKTAKRKGDVLRKIRLSRVPRCREAGLGKPSLKTSIVRQFGKLLI
jgi:hypothetical protein